jgi:hypothetical protein
MNPEMPKTEPVPPLPEKTVGYCRVCGKALTEQTAHSAHGTIFCAEHVPAERPAAGPPPLNYPGTPYVAPHYTAPPTSSASPYSSPGAANVSPAAAFLLGLIPGVGAIYNGQYAKGLVHALILGVLLAVANTDVPGVPNAVAVLLVITFWAYMPFEAYHTARKRKAGMAVEEFSGLSSPNSAGTRFPVAAILLIVFGVAFLLSNLDLLDLRRILRYWPVLMIGLGVYLLWQRVAARPPKDSQTGGGMEL